MKKVSIEELKALHETCYDAIHYALEHQHEIQARSHAHTLYGPYSLLIGACAPSSHVTPNRARKLLKNTRRKQYMAYELDDSYQVIRVRQIHGDERYDNYSYPFELFEMNGIRYAFVYYGTRKQTDRAPYARIIAYKYENGKPAFYADATAGFLFVQYFEHPYDEIMQVSTYRLFLNTPRTPHGLPVNWDAPMGAEDSPVQMNYYEECPAYIDFEELYKSI